MSGNLFAAIHGHLRGGPCKPYKSDCKFRLRIDQRDLFYYPDVMVAPRVHSGSDSVATFESIGLSLALEQIYEGVL